MPVLRKRKPQVIELEPPQPRHARKAALDLHDRLTRRANHIRRSSFRRTAVNSNERHLLEAELQRLGGMIRHLHEVATAAAADERRGVSAGRMKKAA